MWQSIGLFWPQTHLTTVTVGFDCRMVLCRIPFGQYGGQADFTTWCCSKLIQGELLLTCSDGAFASNMPGEQCVVPSLQPIMIMQEEHSFDDMEFPTMQ